MISSKNRPDRSISIVVSAKEFDHIDALAGRYGLSPAELIRRCARNVADLNEGLRIASVHRKEAP